MKIHYSPFFEGEKYIDFLSRGNLLFNEKVVGTAGLLNELELHSGLGCQCSTKIEREASYYNIVKKVIESKPGCLFESSFRIDEYGVASELLKWRDELILAGWRPDIKGISVKLDLLAEIEEFTIKEKGNIRGESDRWRAVMENPLQALGNDDELVIYFPETLLPPFISEYFTCLSKNGVKCSYKVPNRCIADEGTNLYKIQRALLTDSAEPLNPTEVMDESFRICLFDRHISAMEWVVVEPFNAGSAFINSDNRSFDNIQALFNRPLSGSSLSDSNPEIVQLLKLGCSLFIRPFNIYNLLSYLQISRHPIPLALRRNLINVIIRMGGIVNQDWEDSLNSFFSGKDKKRDDIMVFLPVENLKSDIIQLSSVKNYVKELKSWAAKMLSLLAKDKKDITGDLEIQQLSALINLCNAFLIILNGQTIEVVSVDKLKSWILSIYRPDDYSGTKAQSGSRLIISSPAAFVDPAKKVTWIDCFNGSPKSTLFRFLNASEFETLLKKGVRLWREELQIKALLFAQKLAVLNCSSKFTMVVSDRDKCEKLTAHPLYVQLSAQFTNLKTTEHINPAPAGVNRAIDHKPLPGMTDIIDIGTHNLFTPRKKESQSSLTTLIQNPLDYVLNYQAALAGNSVIELSDEKRTMGNVAHLFIEELVNDSEKDLMKMKQLMTSDFSERLENAVTEKGAILFLEENKILLTEFSWQLKKSVNNLLAIIENNDMKIIGCEIIKDCAYSDDLMLESRIDMLLENKAGQMIIFDMKWTTSTSYYKNLLKENRALQLEVYSVVLQKSDLTKNVAAVAYFDLSHGVLETISDLKGKYINITLRDNNTDIFRQCMNSYAYRWKQLDEGKIEAGENMELEMLEYNNDCEAHNLFPLEADYRNNELKKINEFSDFKTFKGGLL